ncbi:MAG: UDP-N-acetylmuramate dehydrogenase [Candidatus Saccharimonadales bacterium]|nr:UDP-N-acetylmuramate dehydrogenase [Candidatus Saccharimonadales bacterium]
MQIYENVSLRDYSTMRLGGKAKYLSLIDDLDDLNEVVDWAKKFKQKILTIGDGSNIIFRDTGWDGLVIVMRNKGIKVVGEDDHTKTLKIQAGELWDDVVKKSVEMGLSGIEALSLIPGTAGATPVQNVGAYGQEISDTLVSVEILNHKANRLSTLKAADCKFSYRNSVFKTHKGKENIIVSITLKLNKQPMKPPFYESLQKQLDIMGVKEFLPQKIRDAVVTIRNSKLPDPKVIANTGSFFQNPVLKEKHYETLKETYPDLPGFDVIEGFIKVPAGWLLEKAGFKAYRHPRGMGTYDMHALVFVNYDARSYRDLAEFKKEVQDKIKHMFGIELEQEPETI